MFEIVVVYMLLGSVQNERRLHCSARKSEAIISRDLSLKRSVLDRYKGLAALLLALGLRSSSRNHRRASLPFLAAELAQPPLRKGYGFDKRPVFQELSLGNGRISSGSAISTVQFASFGPLEGFSGKLVEAQPSAANTPLMNDIKGAIAVVSRGAASFETKMRHCSAAGALGVVLVNSEDKIFVAAPDAPEVQSEAPKASLIPFVVVSSSDGAKLSGAGVEANVAPYPLQNVRPLFPLAQPLFPGSSRKVQVSNAAIQGLKQKLQDSNLSDIEAVAVMSREGKVASIGTLANVEIVGEASDKVIIRLHGQRPCVLRDLYWESTAESFSEVLIDMASDKDRMQEGADARSAMYNLFAKLGYDPEDNLQVDPERLSFKLCYSIEMNSMAMQAALELDTVGRFRGLAKLFGIDPKRGRELVADAVGIIADAR